MANTYTSLHYHIVFSTKNRERWIKPEFEDRIWAYLGGIANKNKMKPLQIGGVNDHVHVLLGAPAVLAPATIAKLLKGDSSAWIQQTFPPLKGFGWQDGYSAFTVSRSDVPVVIAYIQGQREHHRTKSFQEEYRELLKRHGIEFDERYLGLIFNRRYATEEICSYCKPWVETHGYHRRSLRDQVSPTANGTKTG